MQVKALISILALGTALAFAGPASAQTIDGVAISATDLPKVQARCDELATASATQSTSTDATNSDSSSSDQSAGSGTNDATVADAPAANGADALTVSSINLETLTADQCKAGGLTK